MNPNKLRVEFEKLEGMKMAFCQHGNGQSLLFLHGNSLSKAIFKRYQLEYFSNFHTYALDSRGHGHSRSRIETLNYEQMSLDVIEFCQARDIKRASVIGYSDGGILALWLAVKKPDLFTSIAAISPNTRVNGTTDRTLHLIQGLVDRQEWLARFVHPVKKQLVRFKLLLTDSGISGEALMKIQSRVMLLYAERDMVKEEHILEIASKIPGVELKKIMNSNHLNIIYQMETITALKQFLEP